MLQRQITGKRDISTWQCRLESACSGSAAVMKPLCLKVWLPSVKVRTGWIQRSALFHTTFLHPSSACKMDSKILNLETVLYLTQRRLPGKLPWLYQESAYKGHLQTWHISWQPKRMPFSLGWRHHLFPLVKVYKNFRIYFRIGDYTSIISMLSRTCI